MIFDFVAFFFFYCAVVKQCKKQKVDIDRILLDTRALQKEINEVSDKLGRSFLLANEMVFGDAKKVSAKKKKNQL